MVREKKKLLSCSHTEIYLIKMHPYVRRFQLLTRAKDKVVQEIDNNFIFSGCGVRTLWLIFTTQPSSLSITTESTILEVSYQPEYNKHKHLYICMSRDESSHKWSQWVVVVLQYILNIV